jgi:hypothetical protein
MQQGPGEGRATGVFVFVLISTVLLGAARLAWGNLRRGQGACRLFCFIAITSLLSWLFRADHVPTIEERTLIAQAIKDALLLGGITWLLYLALEPFVRRRWPQTIVSWSRPERLPRWGALIIVAENKNYSRLHVRSGPREVSG